MMVATAPLQQINVSAEQDVIRVRQEARQLARQLGMGLVEQAKLTAAISGVARIMLICYQSMVFTLRAADQGRQLVLEIACIAPGDLLPLEMVKLEQALTESSTRMLVDEVDVSCATGSLVLILRVWQRREKRSDG